MSAYPYIEGMTVHDYFKISTDTKSCSVDGCKEDGNNKCKKNLCYWKFCTKHCDHKHYNCCAIVNGISCNAFGIYGIEEYPEGTICENHYKKYNKKCYTPSCNNITQTSGYCSKCFGLQYSLHKQGYSSLFGSGTR